MILRLILGFVIGIALGIVIEKFKVYTTVINFVLKCYNWCKNIVIIVVNAIKRFFKKVSLIKELKKASNEDLEKALKATQPKAEEKKVAPTPKVEEPKVEAFDLFSESEKENN